MRTINKIKTIIAATAMIGVGLLGGTPSTFAVYGGNGNPYYDCPGGQTVASVNIAKDGVMIGLVEMRWAWSCSGNWTGRRHTPVPTRSQCRLGRTLCRDLRRRR